jgi:hypothetical protein
MFTVCSIPNESPSLQPPSSRGALGPAPATVNPLRLNGPPNGQTQRDLTGYNGRSTKLATFLCA